jgi:hypothetical protein
MIKANFRDARNNVNTSKVLALFRKPPFLETFSSQKQKEGRTSPILYQYQRLKLPPYKVRLVFILSAIQLRRKSGFGRKSARIGLKPLVS